MAYKVVADTNIIVNATMRTGKSYLFLQKSLFHGECILITSEELISEVEYTLSKPKFSLSEENIGGVVTAFKLLLKIIEIKSKLKVVREDPDGDIIINTAYDGHADYIVTGDQDLLRLNEYDELK